MQKVGEWRIFFVCSMAHNPPNPGSLNRRNERTRGPKSGAALISMHGACKGVVGLEAVLIMRVCSKH
jgi:hypothetical protein